MVTASVAGCTLPIRSSDPCAERFDRVAFPTHYEDQAQPFDGARVATALRDLNYTRNVSWNDTQISAEKPSNWTFDHPATERLTIAGSNGTYSMGATLSMSLAEPCSSRDERDAACVRWEQMADLAFSFFDGSLGWSATRFDTCSKVPATTP